jgi:hypothetical protein
MLQRVPTSADGPSAWADGEVGAGSPSVQLRLLDSHKREWQPPALDRWGQWLSALSGRWVRPLPRLRRLAARVQHHPFVGGEDRGCVVVL